MRRKEKRDQGREEGKCAQEASIHWAPCVACTVLGALRPGWETDFVCSSDSSFNDVWFLARHFSLWTSFFHSKERWGRWSPSSLSRPVPFATWSLHRPGRVSCSNDCESTKAGSTPHHFTRGQLQSRDTWCSLFLSRTRVWPLAWERHHVISRSESPVRMWGN